jgi:threonine dehydrogenase-like Zn-dependent dehydrogenase
MHAARLIEPRRVAIEHAAVPEPGAGEVRMQIQGCGLCGSNLAPWQGLPWLHYPLAAGELGHEAWGIVDRVGEGVDGLQLGQRCAFLSSRAFAEYCVTSAATLVSAPAEAAIFPGEALGCVFNIARRAEIRPGGNAAVIGVGFIGALLIQLASKVGARVIAVSRRPFSLEIAERMGATDIVSTGDAQAAARQVMELTNGAGCERVIEAAGTQASLDLASGIVGCGGRLIIAGYHQDGPRQVNLQSWNWRGIDVINAHERSVERNVAGVRAAADAIAAGTLDPTPLYTHEFSLAQCGEAFETLSKRPVGFVKGWIRFQGAERLNA